MAQDIHLNATLSSMGAADPSQAPGRVRSAAAQAQPGRVRGSWLLGALGLLLLAALLCAYLSLCLLFAQGQWQLLYHPAHTLPATPESLGIDFTPVRLGSTDAGVSELSGWWLPALPSSALRGSTVLYLHGGTGSLSDTLPDLAYLHALGCAILAIDYRGFGSSARQNPSESGMVDDAARAIDYLVDTRHIAAGSIVVWGQGIGATIAAEAASSRPDHALLRLVLQDVNPPALELLREDNRTRMLPVRLLLRDRLDAGQALASSSARKLFLGGAANTTRLYTLSAPPKEQRPDKDDETVQSFLAGRGQAGP